MTSVTLHNSAPRRYAVRATQKLTFTCLGNGPRDTQQLVMFGLTPVLPAGPANIRGGRNDSSGTSSSAAQAGQIMAVALDG